MLLADETTDLSKGRWIGAGQTVGLTVAPDRAFDMSWLDFGTVKGNGSGLINKRLVLSAYREGMARMKRYLGNVKAASSALAVPQNDEDSGFLHSSPDAVHFGRLFDERVGHVFVDEQYIYKHGFCPYAPGETRVSSESSGGANFGYIDLTTGNRG